jgi:hypothetical protein
LQLAAEYGYPAERVRAQADLYNHIITLRKLRPYGVIGLIALVFIGAFVGGIVLLRKTPAF